MSQHLWQRPLSPPSSGKPNASQHAVVCEPPAALVHVPQRALIWDLPLRLFHWALVASVAGAWLTAESERWRDVHVQFGYAVALLLTFRVLWLMVGTRHARWSALLLAPRQLWRYVGSVLSGRPQHHVGHNPAGSWAIVAMLSLLAGTAASGLLNLFDVGGLLKQTHEPLAEAVLAVIAVHVIGVMLSSLLHNENLVLAMVHGRKRMHGAAVAVRSRPLVAIALAVGIVLVWVVKLPGL